MTTRCLLLTLLFGCLPGSWISVQAQVAPGPKTEIQPVNLTPELPRPAISGAAGTSKESGAGSQPATSSAPSPDGPRSTPSRAEPQLPPEAHPWGRFPVGSWKLVRVSTQTLDADGKPISTSVTETKTTLVEANDFDYTLKVEVTVQVEGKHFARPPQIAKLSYWGDLSEAPLGVRKVGTSEIEMNGKRLACEIRQVVTEQEGQRRQSVVHYCDTTYPYVLKRESSVTSSTAESKPQTTSVEVVGSNLPYPVLGTTRSAAFVKTSRHTAAGDSTTIEVQSPEVPGGVVSHSAQEQDQTQALSRRSTLELIDYGLGSEPPEEASPGRKRWFHRSRARRAEEALQPRR